MHNEQLNRFTAQRYGYEEVLGWRERAVGLRDKLEEDSQAYKRFARRNKAGYLLIPDDTRSAFR